MTFHSRCCACSRNLSTPASSHTRKPQNDNDNARSASYDRTFTHRGRPALRRPQRRRPGPPNHDTAQANAFASRSRICGEKGGGGNLLPLSWPCRPRVGHDAHQQNEKERSERARSRHDPFAYDGNFRRPQHHTTTPTAAMLAAHRGKEERRRWWSRKGEAANEKVEDDGKSKDDKRRTKVSPEYDESTPTLDDAQRSRNEYARNDKNIP